MQEDTAFLTKALAAADGLIYQGAGSLVVLRPPALATFREYSAEGDLLWFSVYGIALTGDWVYLATPDNGLLILDRAALLK